MALQLFFDGSAMASLWFWICVSMVSAMVLQQVCSDFAMGSAMVATMALEWFFNGFAMVS